METYIPERISLIIPPSLFLLDERVFMSLGILKIAAVLERKGAIVEVLDLSGISNYLDAVEDHSRSTESKIFALTATTPQLPATIEIVKKLRSVREDAQIILGGPHITLTNAACKLEKKSGIQGRAHRALEVLLKNFDCLVAGDGEKAIFFACHNNAPQIIDADDTKSELFLSNQMLTELPFPARHLVDVQSYHYQIDGVSAFSLIAQLGCPFGCGFCGGRASPMLRRIRMRTSENIIAEMEHLYCEYGCRGFMMYDDELNVNREMISLMNLIAEKQRELGVEWRLRGFIKAQLFTDEQAEVMYNAGFRWILVGFESGSERILTNINKKSTQDENTRCLKIAHHHGLKVKALMSLGHPGESLQTIRETSGWLTETRPDDFDITIITCYPGSPYYDEAISHPNFPSVWMYTHKTTKDVLYQKEIDYTQVADYYKGDPDGGYEAYVFTDFLTPRELVFERNALERHVRKALSIPFNSSAVAIQYEHSMGQGGVLPSHILRKSIVS